MQKIIKGKNFRLRTFRLADNRRIVECVNNWNVIRNLSNLPYPYKMKDATAWIKKITKSMKKKNPTDHALAIEFEGALIGAVGLHETAEKYKAELGYWIAEDYWGRGIMSEVVKLMTDFGFKRLGLKRIYARVYLSNIGSEKVLQKNKFKFEGIERKGAKKGNKYIDCKVYAKIK